ncbi:hypothetical protein H6784_00450 [Candidatus Nomurabacteria bacterium]|nr:hypothetical protein [Candidatus Kaiserbacteria bacterium]MCB9813863.1 hypothetical protein [Candidatus Nomurabacteria bacterium]
MKAVYEKWTLWLVIFFFVIVGVFVFSPQVTNALKINEYKDTLSDSGPLEQANHTFDFVLNTDVSPGGIFEITPPAGFTVLSTTTFAERNVELLVNGSARTAGTVAAPGVDQVEITAGSPGFFRYTLAPDSGLTSGSRLKFKIGNHTSNSVMSSVTFSTSTGTTTNPGDVEPIVNSGITGKHDVKLEVYDGGLVANANFVIFLNEKVSVPNIDTTEEIPPFRFGGSPTSSVGGTTLFVEIGLETDEFAICKYSTVADIPFGSMSDTFSNTGLVFHTTVVQVVPNSLAQFYVRCIDDEGNFNIDDYLIAFTVNDIPTGTSNTDGNVDGDGTGTGNDGTGSGGGGGGTSGSSDGEAPTEGGTSGGGGSGGGGGGGSGGGSGSTAGGGFESTSAPYRSGDGRVIISGYAYPNSTVSILVDGNFFDTTKASNLGVYSITLDEIARGVYTFGVYAQGSNNIKSSTFSTSFTVTGARTSALGNINVSPSILVAPNPVQPGEVLTVSGFSLPNAKVTIQNGRLKSSVANKEYEVQSDSQGRWSTTIDTTGFTVDTYQVRAKAEQEGGAVTHYSDYTFYGVGQKADLPINTDLNRDGKVNLIDFSIMLFWWNTNGGDSDPPADINRDGKVSLTDFSILLFNWTG